VSLCYFWEKRLMINSLSLVFPVFNEESRINNSLSKIKKFILNSKLEYLEIVFVDDGSKDNTYSIIQNFILLFKKNIKIKFILLRNLKNIGKGYSLKKGINHCRAEWILTSDIDLSVTLSHYLRWSQNKILDKNCFVYFGSRNHISSNVKKNFLRYLLGCFFRTVIYFLFRIKLFDTQCGYKLYKNKIARKLFSKLKDKRFAHDVEIVLLANSMKILIKEMPVKWVHKKNSKINIFKDIFVMFWDLLIIKKRFLNRV